MAQLILNLTNLRFPNLLHLLKYQPASTVTFLDTRDVTISRQSYTGHAKHQDVKLELEGSRFKPH